MAGSGTSQIVIFLRGDEQPFGGNNIGSSPLGGKVYNQLLYVVRHSIDLPSERSRA